VARPIPPPNRARGRAIRCQLTGLRFGGRDPSLDPAYAGTSQTSPARLRRSKEKRMITPTIMVRDASSMLRAPWRPRGGLASTP